MTEHQKRLLMQMLSSIVDYKSGHILFENMVVRLESALQAGDFDAAFTRSFYERWTNLEMVSVLVETGEAEPADANADVRKMFDFLDQAAERDMLN